MISNSILNYENRLKPFLKECCRQFHFLGRLPMLKHNHLNMQVLHNQLFLKVGHAADLLEEKIHLKINFQNEDRRRQNFYKKVYRKLCHNYTNLTSGHGTNKHASCFFIGHCNDFLSYLVISIRDCQMQCGSTFLRECKMQVIYSIH